MNNIFINEGHFYYGTFLAKNNRLKESRDQYHICCQHTPNKALNQYRLSDVLYKLGDSKAFEYHINLTLELDPYHPLANKLYEYYQRHGTRNKDLYGTANSSNSKCNDNSNATTSTGSADDSNYDYDMGMLHPDFKSWLRGQCLLDQFGYIFVKYQIYSLNDLREKQNVKFGCRPIERNVIKHAAEMYNAQSGNN